MACAEDLVADMIFGFVGCGGRFSDDDASEFRAGDPREWGLVLVFAADLEEVEEIRRCMDGKGGSC